MRRGSEVDAGSAETITLEEYRAHVRQRRAARESVNLRFHRLAVAEIDREVDYYESHHVGLVAEREDEIDAALEVDRVKPRTLGRKRGRQ